MKNSAQITFPASQQQGQLLPANDGGKCSVLPLAHFKGSNLAFDCVKKMRNPHVHLGTSETFWRPFCRESLALLNRFRSGRLELEQSIPIDSADRQLSSDLIKINFSGNKLKVLDLLTNWPGRTVDSRLFIYNYGPYSGKQDASARPFMTKVNTSNLPDVGEVEPLAFSFDLRLKRTSVRLQITWTKCMLTAVSGLLFAAHSSHFGFFDRLC
jgi:hypothetical protein